MTLLTRITSIFSSLRSIERRAEESAKAAVVFVAQVYHQLDGELRHNRVVAMLREAYPSLKGWTLQALAGAAYGYIKARTPEKLKPALGAVADAVEDEIEKQAPPEITEIRSPFGVAHVDASGALVHPLTRLEVGRQPSADTTPPDLQQLLNHRSTTAQLSPTSPSQPLQTIANSAPGAPGVGESSPPRAAIPQPKQLQPFAPSS